MKKFVLAGLFITALLTYAVPAQAADDIENKEASVTLTEETDPNELLKITNASDLNFGSKSIGVDDLFFTDDNNPEITITDIRGNAPGWKLLVGLGEFVDAATNRKLLGAQLFYPAVTMTTNSTIDVSTRMPVTSSSDQSFSNAGVNGLVVPASATPAPQVLINAPAGKGNGRWSAIYDSNNKIELNVPAGNLAGNYVADLVYTLSDTPSTP